MLLQQSQWERSFILVQRLKQREAAPESLVQLGIRIHKPHRVQCSTVSIQSLPPNTKTGRSNKHTSLLIKKNTQNSTTTRVNMSLGQIYCQTPWFPDAIIVSTFTRVSHTAGKTFKTAAMRQLDKSCQQSLGLRCSSGIQTRTGKHGANPSRQGRSGQSLTKSSTRQILLNTILSAKERRPTQTDN